MPTFFSTTHFLKWCHTCVSQTSLRNLQDGFRQVGFAQMILISSCELSCSTWSASYKDLTAGHQVTSAAECSLLPMSDSGPSLFGPSLAPDATYAERQVYRRDVLRLPGPVDRWLTTNSRSPHMAFLQDYLLLADIRQEYVLCFVEYVRVPVCSIHYFITSSLLCNLHFCRLLPTRLG
jgi:hypothetical protein